MQDLAAKQATSLLRYIGPIPADKAFYEAGNGNAQFAVPLMLLRWTLYLYSTEHIFDIHVALWWSTVLPVCLYAI